MGVIFVMSCFFLDGDFDLVECVVQVGYCIFWGFVYYDFDELCVLLYGVDVWIVGIGLVIDVYLVVGVKFKVVVCYGVGIEVVDLEVVCECGILVMNIFGVNVDVVVDYVVGFMFVVLCIILDGDCWVWYGDWSVCCGWEFGVVIVGIVGFGWIGQGVVWWFGGFGLWLFVVDLFLFVEFVYDCGVEFVDFDDLFCIVDVIMLYVFGGQCFVDVDCFVGM